MNWLTKRIRAKLTNFVLDVVFREVQVGGHCGCCGKWVSHHLTEVGYGVTLCDACVALGESDK